MNANQEREVDKLLSKAIDGTLVEADVVLLVQYLHDSQSARELWKEALSLNADLGKLFNPPRAFSAEELLRIEQARSDAQIADVVEAGAATSPQKREFGYRRLTFAIAIAASLAVAAFFITDRFGQEPAQDNATDDIAIGDANRPAKTIAVIRRTVGSDLGRDVMQSKSIVAGSFLEFSRGLVELRVGDGVTVVARGPASFRLVSSEEVRLSFGRLTATVEEGFEGFRLITDDATFTDLGTTFSVAVDSEGTSKLDVHSGLVEATSPLAPGTSQRFKEGKTVIVSPDKGDQFFGVSESTNDQWIESLAKPHALFPSSDDTYLIGGLFATHLKGDLPQIWVKLDLDMPKFCRRGLLGFDLTKVNREQIIGARLTLIIDPNNRAKTRIPSYRKADIDWQFGVFGVADDDSPRWGEATVSWSQSPDASRVNSLGQPTGRNASRRLGEFTIRGHGRRGETVTIQSADLVDHLRFDADGYVTIGINRLSGVSWGAPGADEVVHSFASNNHESLPAPTLEVWFDDEK